METNRDDLGLSIDMLDVDRLRYWLGVIEDAIGDVEDDPTRTVPTLSNLPDRLEEAVRDIGVLREQAQQNQAQMVEQPLVDGHEVNCPAIQAWNIAGACKCGGPHIVPQRPALTDAQILQMLDEVHQAKRDGASVVRGSGMSAKDGTVMIEEAACATVRAFLTQAGVL